MIKKRVYKYQGVYLIIIVIVLFASLFSFAENKQRPKIIQLEEITIEGKVQKPNAFYVLTRSNLAFEKREMKKSFLNKVIQSVENEPF